MLPVVERPPALPATTAEQLSDAHCANCDSRLAGPYCHACGQRDTDHLASVREFLAHLAEVAVGYDSRLLRTARALFTRPGELTAEYVAGRRARYASPLPTYLLAAALLFATTSVRPIVRFLPETQRFHSEIATMGNTSQLTPATIARVRARGMSLDLFGERFANESTKRLSTFLVLLLPVIALLVAGTFIGSKRPFAHHMLFALHWSSFYLILLAALQLVPHGMLHSTPLILANLGGSLLYFVIALRRAYGIGWLGSLLRGVPLFFTYVSIIVMWLKYVTEYTARHL